MGPRILLTGPVDGIAEYAESVRSAGWIPIEHPLLAVEPVHSAADAIDLSGGAALCITSSSAWPCVERALARGVAPGSVACFVVGARTAEHARRLGFRLAAEPAAGVAELARAVLAATPRPGRVLWPRGDRSDALARTLREQGLEVADPVVYATRTLPPRAVPEAEAVFFASPSAVSAWRASRPPALDARLVVIAIGPTTAESLRGETARDPRATIVLSEPTHAALARVLAHLDPKSP